LEKKSAPPDKILATPMRLHPEWHFEIPVFPGNPVAMEMVMV